MGCDNKEYNEGTSAIVSTRENKLQKCVCVLEMSAKSLKRNYNIKTDYGNVFVRVWYTVQGETCGQSVMEF